MINPQAGLGAMMQPAQTQKGMPASNMSQIMSTAKGMSDAQLADVMAGKSMDVPQYVAMTEAMGRQQLRTAMQGATAMTTAKQPTEKEKLLLAMQHIPQQSLAQDPAVAAAIAARQGQQPQQPMQQPAPQQPAAGLAAAPAPNMESIGHAGGGIIAFGDGDAVKDPYKDEWWRKPWAAIQDVVGMPIRTVGTAAQYGLNKPLQAMGVPVPNVPPSMRYGSGSADFAQFQNKLDAERAIGPGAVGDVDPSDRITDIPLLNANTGKEEPAAAKAAPAAGGSAKAAPAKAGLADALDLAQPKERPDPFANMDESKEEMQGRINKNKDQGLGSFMMQIGAKLLSTPGFGRALGAGVEAGMPGVEATRKENLGLEKERQMYQFNLAKARDAHENGNEQLAFHYKKLASDHAFHVGELAVKGRMADAMMARAGAGGAGMTGRTSIAAVTQANKYIQDQLKNDRNFRAQWKQMGPDGQANLQAQLVERFHGQMSGGGGQGVPMPTGPQVVGSPSKGDFLYE